MITTTIMNKRGLWGQSIRSFQLGALCFALSLSPVVAQEKDAGSPSDAQQTGASEELAQDASEPPSAEPSATPAPEHSAHPWPTADDGGLPNLQLLNPFNSPFRQQNFVPDISLILDLGAGGRSLSNAQNAELLNPFHFRQSRDAHHLINPNNGFNLNYAELTMSAPVDPYVDLFTTFHLSSFEFEIEEAYANSRGLPGNIQVKAGKFLSHFGRINPQHAHFWSFSDQPLIHQSIFGNEGLNELGLRVSWLAPTDFYLDLGAEILQGTNTSTFGTGGFSAGANRLPEVNLPNLVVGTLKSSIDLPNNIVLLGGLSYAQGGTRIVEGVDSHGHGGEGDLHIHQLNDSAQLLPPALLNYAGGSQVAGADLSLRWFIDSYRELSWQSEFLLRHSSGSVYDAEGAQDVELWQSGLYSQLLWRFAQQWRTGLRLDLLAQNQQSIGNQSYDQSWKPRYSAMMEFLPTEFTRFRLQYNLDQSKSLDGNNPWVHSAFINVNLVMGAHGAHEF